MDSEFSNMRLAELLQKFSGYDEQDRSRINNQILEECSKILKSNELLAEEIDKKNAFLGVMAHDIKSPFNGFLGLTYLLSEEFDRMDRSELREIIMTLRKSAVNMYNMLENLLEYSRLQRKMSRFEPELCDIMDIYVELLESLGEEAAAKKISFSASIPSEMKVYADPRMLKFILKNLLHNGIKYSNPGDAVKISTSVTPDGFVRVDVIDHGIGMAKEDLSKLFNTSELYKRPGTHGEPGSGLGLILVEEYIRRHHGSISIESNPGAGTEVCLKLPLQDELIK